ncbi:hypothetical protein GBF35_11275 [Nonomuraea phyllanthi]|uniref:hypothetical protein n=1 Tax=Nonomuraea phyllanthi TaxID=2219224 RepID=UPI001293537E|nr:hypothetical protein [Nonomuraea phyllanthi]QFY07189.1 hypothetical protein GBF35_11275 [Nonomuraea phyllanthi]
MPGAVAIGAGSEFSPFGVPVVSPAAGSAEHYRRLRTEPRHQGQRDALDSRLSGLAGEAVTVGTTSGTDGGRR